MPALEREAPQQQRTHPWKGQGVHPSHAGTATASLPVPCSLTPSLSAPQGRNHVSQNVWAAAVLDLVWPPAPTGTETANRDCASLTQVFIAASARNALALGPGGIGRNLPVPVACCLQCCCDGVGDELRGMGDAQTLKPPPLPPVHFFPQVPQGKARAEKRHLLFNPAPSALGLEELVSWL